MSARRHAASPEGTRAPSPCTFVSLFVHTHFSHRTLLLPFLSFFLLFSIPFSFPTFCFSACFSPCMFHTRHPFFLSFPFLPLSHTSDGRLVGGGEARFPRAFLCPSFLGPSVLLSSVREEGRDGTPTIHIAHSRDQAQGGLVQERHRTQCACHMS